MKIFRLFFCCLCLIATKSAFALSTDKAPMVSVIMPVYNTEKYLNQAIDSVLKQTYSDFEFIIVDDKSTDSSLKKAQQAARFDRRVKVVPLEHNSRPAAARNKGVENATGKYILIIDSDDYLEKNALEIIVKAAEENNLDILLFDNKVYDDTYKTFFDNLFIVQKPMRDMEGKIFSAADVYENFFNLADFVTWNKLIRRDLIRDNNLRFYQVNFYDDHYLIILAMLYAKRMMYIPDKLYIYRINRVGSQARSFSMVGRVNGIYELSTKLMEVFDTMDLPPSFWRSMKKWLKRVTIETMDEELNGKIRNLMDSLPVGDDADEVSKETEKPADIVPEPEDMEETA